MAPQLSLGASFVAMYGYLSSELAINNLTGPDGQLTVDAHKWGYGANLGVTVPQGVNGSFYRQVDDRWALLGSVGWQQWSRFGYVEIGVDSNDPVSLTSNLHFKDTWHVAVGAQHQLDSPWRLDFGVAYDSAFQDSSNVSPMLPANSAWRFGVGAQKQQSPTFSWGVAAEYAYGGTLDVDKRAAVPVGLGGRGDLVGSYNNTGIFFLSGNLSWKF